VSQIHNDMHAAALERWGQGHEGLPILDRLGARGTLLAPIRTPHGILGVIVLVTERADRRYDADDLALVEEIGRRAGVALDHARLFRASQQSAEVARAAAREAEEASRAKDEFLATVSHELRTPLSAILGWATLLKDRVVDSTMTKPIEVIHRNAHAQVKLIDDILDVSRIITGKFRLDPKPTDLVSLARDAVEVVRPSADAKRLTIEFVRASEEEYCLLVADPERLQQVIWNLLSNAVKFTEQGGKLVLEVAQDGSQVVLVVRDTGRGIDPAFLPFVFERFKQADSSITRRVGGLGLGLALVRHIVELHGGRVAATSDGLGRGATFRVTLPIRAVVPLAAEAALPARPSRPDSGAPPALAPVSLGGVRVLIVDDEPDARDLVAAVVAQCGAEIETASSAAEGFAAFTRFRPDVVVSDIGMPVEDGFSFIRRIRALPTAEGGRIPALALTAFSRESDRTKAISAGFTTHIGKPVDPDTLASAVGNLVGIRQRG
jgi:signal transduction histidine kinase